MDGSGKVTTAVAAGIGTTAPATRLHVYGADNDGVTATLRIQTSGSGQVMLLDGDEIETPFTALNLNGTVNRPVFLAQGGGNVGIGITAIPRKMNIGGHLILNTDSSSPFETGGELVLANGNPATTPTWHIDNGFGRFRVFHQPGGINSAGSEKLSILANGNVGIGTGNPTNKLDVAGVIRGQSVSAFGDVLIVGNDSKIVDVNVLHTMGIYSNTDSTQGHIQLGSGGPKLSGKNGNLGIGRSDPTSKLYVAGGKDTRITIDDSTRAWSWAAGWKTGVAGDFSLIEEGVAGDRIYVQKGTGNVGIGTDNPSADLHVVGDARVTGSYRDSSNSSGTSGQVLSSTGSGTDWVNAPTGGTPVVEAWQTPTFQLSWVNYGAGYNPAGYFKDSSGVVHLRGLVRAGVINASPGIFTLPVGYRPPGRGIFNAMTNPNVSSRLDVLANGQVISLTGNNGWVSLEGITFRVGP